MLRSLKRLIGLTKKNTKKESSPIHTSAPGTENNNGSLNIEREIIKDTPFTMVGTPKHGYWLTMGKHRISQAFKTKKEVIKHLSKKDWTLITAIMIAFIHDRDLIDKAYTKDTSIPPDEKSKTMASKIVN